jgi:hypothetical protein
MCTASFYKRALNITIRNLYPDLDLTSPVYCNNGALCYVPPRQQIHTGSTMKASFGMVIMQYNFEGALLYKLQRRHATRTYNQPNSSVAYTKDTATNIHLLVVLDVKDHPPKFSACLIEYADYFTWDEDKLWALYKKYRNRFHTNYKSSIITWLMNDGTVVETKLDATHRFDYKLNIVLSEGIREHNTRRPMEVDPKRSVLSLLMLIVLMYAIRFFVRPSVKLNIYNQCANVDLVSPTYITGYRSACLRPPDYKVCASDATRSSFIIKENNEADGVLIYRLQRRQPRESTETSENASNAVQLLVIWKLLVSKKLDSIVLLVEHDKRFDWDKDDLMGLRFKNMSWLRRSNDPPTKIWLLSDNVALMTTSEMMHKDGMLNITISEVERDTSTIIPPYIEPKR